MISLNPYPSEGWQALAGLRADCYATLSALFLAAPSDELWRQVLNPDFRASLEELFGERAGAFSPHFAACLSAGRQEAEQEFNALFLAPAGRYVAPYESAFREKRVLNGVATPGLLMGRTTAAISAFYGECAALTTGVELPDHVGMELGFMQLLLAKERAAWANGSPTEALTLLRKERQFLADHLAAWAPELCEAICKRSQHDFYRGLARLTQEFVALEMDLLSEFAP